MNLDLGPIIVNAWVSPADNRHAFGCPLCREWSEVAADALDHEVNCRHCDGTLRIAPTTIRADWRPAAAAWAGSQRTADGRASRDGVRESSARSDLSTWLDFVRGQGHLLRVRPNLLFQQAVNTPLGSTVSSTAERMLATGRETRPFFLRLNRPAERAGSTLTLMAHTAPVSECVFAPDGKRIFSASADRTVRIWDSENGALLSTLVGRGGQNHERSAASAFSPDGARVVLSCNSRTLELWDIKSETLVAAMAHPGKVHTCAFSPDGSRIVSDCAIFTSGVLKVWDAITGALLTSLEGHTNAITCHAFSPDSRMIVSGSDDSLLKVWDAKTGTLLVTLSDHKKTWLRGENNRITVCAFSPDGKRILSGARDQTLKLWNANTGDLLDTLQGHEGAVSACAFSPDGRRILSGAEDTTLKIWDALTGSLIATLEGHVVGGRTPINKCSFSPDQKLILTAALDGTIRLWDVETGSAVTTLAGGVSPCAFSPDGSRIVSSIVTGPTSRVAGPTLKVWDVSTEFKGTSSNRHPPGGRVTDCAFSADGKWIVSASSTSTPNLMLWDAATGASVVTQEGHTSEVTACAFSSDSRRVVSAADGILKLWDIEEKALLATLEGHSAAVTGCSFSPDGKQILSYALDCTLKVWDGENGSFLLTLAGHERGIAGAAFSPDGSRIASTSADATLILWDPSSGEIVAGIQFNAAVHGCLFSPDGSRILCAEGGMRAAGGQFQIGLPWRLILCDAIPDSEGHLDAAVLGQSTGAVRCCAFSTDGTRIVSCASGETAVKVWEVKARSLVLELPGHEGEVRVCFFSPDGQHIVTGSDDRMLKVWDSEDGRLVGEYDCGATVTKAHWSPKGDRLVAGTAEGDLLIVCPTNFPASRA